jgi:hypothetical protein
MQQALHELITLIFIITISGLHACSINSTHSTSCSWIISNFSEEILIVFFYFPCVCLFVYKHMSRIHVHVRNNYERSTRIIWNIASHMCGARRFWAYIKATKKWLCQNSVHVRGLCQKCVECAKSAWNVTKVRIDLFREILTAERQLCMATNTR